MPRRRSYPHVDQISDPQVQQAVRILFDRVFALGDGVEAATTRLGAAQSTLASQQAQLRALEQSGGAADGKFTSDLFGPGVGQPGSPGSPIPPPDIDDGEGAAGCASAGATGHLSIDIRRLPAARVAGMIVCGTAQEFSALTAAVVDLPTREANAVELLGRMIWHLQIPQGSPAEVAFEAGRQRNPSTAISKDKLTVKINGLWRAYDVFLDFDNFTTPLVTVMNLVFPPDNVPDGGIPD